VAAPVVVVKTPQELAAEEARRRSDAFKESVQREIADLRRCKTTPSGSASASERFFVRAPANAAPVDLDIMRLAAQFVARNGSKFLNGLIARESRNPQFDFLNADHMYFPFFQQLVESYVAVLNPPADVVTDLLADAKNPLRVLERCLERLELKQQAEAKQNAEGAEEEERAAAAQIDWGTFTIVQTIEFDAAEDPSLPMPQKTIEDINRQLSAADRAVRAQMSAAQAKPRTGGGDDADDIDMDMDDDVDANLKVAGISGQESLPVGMPSASALLAKATGAVLVSNYDYAAALGYKTATTASSSAALKQVCPICAGEFSPAEMPEHLRIELLDPKWREQRQAQLAKHKTSNIAEADEITRNLERLAKRSRAEMSEEVVVSTPSYITSAPARPQLSDLDIIRSGTQQAPRPIAPAMVQPLALQPTPQPVIPLGSLPVPLSAASAAPIAPPPPPSMHPDRLKVCDTRFHPSYLMILIC
jgi:splicing factor 3A subunit 1